MALALKEVTAGSVRVGFTAIPAICGGTGKSVPTLELDDGEIIVDSFEIALWLDARQPEKPLFRGEGAQAHCRLIEGWANTAVTSGVRTMIIADICKALSPVDQTYFRESRLKRFGRTLEDIQHGREDRVGPFNELTLAPVAHALSYATWLGGEAPGYADCIVFGSLVWGPIISEFPILHDGPVKDWFARCCQFVRDEPEIHALTTDTRTT